MTTHNLPPLPLFPVPATFWADGEDLDAARAALLYTASSVSRPTVQKLSALFYFADRLHLGRYGALMFGGRYEALKHGPAPVGAYGLLRAAQAHPEDARAYGFTVQGQGDASPAVVPLAAPDMEELSAAVVDCLNWAIAEHGQADGASLSLLSMDEAWQTCPPGEAMTAAHIAASLPNARAVLEHLADPYPDD